MKIYVIAPCPSGLRCKTMVGKSILTIASTGLALCHEVCYSLRSFAQTSRQSASRNGRRRLSGTLSRTLRARDNGAADRHPLLAWRFAPHNPRMKPTSGEKACGFLAFRGLSAAPLGYQELRNDIPPAHPRSAKTSSKNLHLLGY